MSEAVSQAMAQAMAPAPRPGAEVMRLARMGVFHPTRLGFARTLVRRMARERWRIAREICELDDDGFGTVVYRIDTPAGTLRFVAFSSFLPPERRTDRVIAEQWDSTFVLTTAAPDETTLARLAANVPRQEAGRMSASELILSRANRSVRLFDHVVGRLAAGRQPDLAQIAGVGYLMRTTAVYGNGKFGLGDFAQVVRGGIFRLPFQAEMLTVYMARHYSLELVEHIAARRGTERACALDREAARYLGVGNATGLGMAPFLVTHPALVHRWVAARETAIARVGAVEHATPALLARFRELLERAMRHVAEWRTDDERQQARLRTLALDLERLHRERYAGPALRRGASHPWREVMEWAARHAAPETQELLNSVLLELHPELVDELENETAADERQRIAPGMTLAELRELLERRYDWALALDFSRPGAEHYFWYYSADKEEPRLGERARDPGAEREMGVDIARGVNRLHRELAALDAGALSLSVAEFLMRHPRWRGLVQRVQSLRDCDYAEVRDNLLDASCMPIDLLRCKLSIFGASKFDPKSDRWTRITLFQGAPLADELDRPDADDWCFPIMPRASGDAGISVPADAREPR
ncbi:MAG: hypothetical protein R3286_08710 [Gammaproteobacteria bacterium]|nr:hypothetical protein [Gammaproteobacteria bacterium]